MTTDLDPRWDWIECPEFDGTIRYVRGLCNHLEAVRVESTEGETVAHLCKTCDRQLPPEWKP